MTETVEDSGCSVYLMDEVDEKIHHHHESSTLSDSQSEKSVLEQKILSDSESEKSVLVEQKILSDSESDKSVQEHKKRLFGRQLPLHSVLGGGKSADILLWRNKQISAGILTGMTIVWLLFEWTGYHLIAFICHALILTLAVFFCWSNAPFATKMSPKFPEVILPESLFMSSALSLRYGINRVFVTFRDVATGKDLRKFLMVSMALWIVSVIGSSFNFLTLFYIVFVILHTVPVLYEKHEDHVDTFVEKAIAEINKQYKVLDAKVLQKFPEGPFKYKKLH